MMCLQWSDLIKKTKQNKYLVSSQTFLNKTEFFFLKIEYIVVTNTMTILGPLHD